MTEPPRITIWYPTGPEGEGLANLIRGVIPEADVHLGPVPSPLGNLRAMTGPEFADFQTRWERDRQQRVIVALANTGATWTPSQPSRPFFQRDDHGDPPESRRERRRRLWLHWWQRGGQ